MSVKLKVVLYSAKNFKATLMFKLSKKKAPKILTVFLIVFFLVSFVNVIYKVDFIPICHATSSYTFQPCDADTFISEASPNNNYGTGIDLDLQSYGSSTDRDLVRFNMTGTIPTNATITSATLSLYYYQYYGNDPVGRTFWAYRITQTGWTETGASWYNYKTSTAWTSQGGDYDTTNGSSSTVPAFYSWMNWTVTSQVQYAVAHASDVAHFLIRDGTEGALSQYMTVFRSKESSSSNKPKLYVEWTNGASTISITLSTNPSGKNVSLDAGAWYSAPHT